MRVCWGALPVRPGLCPRFPFQGFGLARKQFSDSRHSVRFVPTPLFDYLFNPKAINGSRLPSSVLIATHNDVTTSQYTALSAGSLRSVTESPLSG